MTNKRKTARRVAYVRISTKEGETTPKSISVAESIEELNRIETRIEKETKHNSKKGSETQPIDHEEKAIDTKFERIAIDLIKSIDQFQLTDNVIGRGRPTIMSNEATANLVKYISENGTKFDETSNSMTYEIPFSLISKINDGIARLNAIQSGLNKLRELIFLGMVSSYDTFLSRVVKEIIIYNGDSISSSERSISLKELLKFDSIEDAKQKIIDKEIESIMRSSHSDQIAWIENRIGKKIKASPLWPTYVEIFERRNIIVHNDSVVNDQYLATCNAAGCAISDVKSGERITLKKQYFRESADLLIEFGIKLIHVTWTKLSKDSTARAISIIGKISYNFILIERYAIAINLIKFVLYETKLEISERSRRRLIINLANATKLSGDMEGAISILDKEDWSASDLVFEICVSAIKNNIDHVIELIPAIHATKSLTSSDFREWPVFHDARNNEKFITKFESVFRERLYEPKSSTFETPQKDLSSDSS